MKYLLISVLFFHNLSIAQIDSTIYFKEIGWTIKLPKDLKITDLKAAADFKSNAKKLEENAGGEVREFGTKLFSAVKQNPHNLITANYYFSPTASPDSLREMINTEFETIYYLFSKQLHGKLDSVGSIEIYDGIKFDKLFMVLVINDKLTFHGVCLYAIYNKIRLGILYTYIDDESEREFLNILKTSKFDK